MRVVLLNWFHLRRRLLQCIPGVPVQTEGPLYPVFEFSHKVCCQCSSIPSYFHSCICWVSIVTGVDLPQIMARFCKKAEKAYRRKYYSANKDEALKQCSNYYAQNSEVKKEQMKKAYALNPQHKILATMPQIRCQGNWQLKTSMP